MKLKKLMAAAMAVSATVVPFSSEAMNAFIPVNTYAASTDTAETLPDWIPDDFESALEFRNTHGTTYIHDDLLCMVFTEDRHCERDTLDPKGEPHYKIYTTGDTMETVKDETYGTKDSQSDYEVVVYKSVKAGKFEVSLADNWVKSSSLESEYGYIDYRSYNTFSVDEKLNITETDDYSWLPDCVTEYMNFKERYGDISAKNNLIAVCLDYTVGTPYTWQLMYRGLSDCIEYYDAYDCSEKTELPLDGGTMHQLKVFKATNDGNAEIGFEYRDDLIYESTTPPQETISSKCVILDNAQTVLLPDDVRVEVLDYDTNEPLKLTYDSEFILADIKSSSVEVLESMGSNPYIIRNAVDKFDETTGLRIPDGYSFPLVENISDYKIYTEYDNGAKNIVFKVKKNNSDIPKNSTKISFYDKDTGELINIPENNDDIWLRKSSSIDYFLSDTYNINSNPCIFDVPYFYQPNSVYNINMTLASGEYEIACFEGIAEQHNQNEVICNLKWKANGDANSDGEFSVSDVVLLQKWLLSEKDSSIADMNSVDLCRDNNIDVFDLIAMKRKLIKSQITEYIEPDNRIEYPISANVVTDGLKLYLGPDESYPCIAEIPKMTHIFELGYQNDNDDWLFTEYAGQFGWIKARNDNSKMTIMYAEVAAKPVIYLYPEQETDVHVELELTESDLSTTYPKYNNGWDVTAYPDGTLLNKSDGTHHKYLFWDSTNCRTRFDYSKGFCVAGEDTESFLREKLTYMGLTEEEMNEFIVYWLPKMEHNKYNLIAFQGDAYTNTAKLNITPNPDSLLRIFMAYVPLEDAVNIEPQQLETFERKGFAVVEWGGCELR